jgi:RNA polymerase sigma-70 factor (ECF subfamily)
MKDERSDGELMTRTREGDPDAFAVLVDRYKNPLVNYLTHLTSSRDRAEDLAQESFIRLFARSDRYRDQGKLSPYLFRIATNLLRSEHRRARRWDRIAPRLIAAVRDVVPPTAALFENEIRRKVRRALADLPLTYRGAVVLREIEGWSYAEIARAIGCAEGTVKSRICRGREMLRQSLAPYWNGEPIYARTD